MENLDNEKSNLKANKNYQVKIVMFLLLIVLAFLIFKLATTFKTQNVENNNLENQPAMQNIVDMSFVENINLTTNSPYIIVSGSYPRFAHVPDEFNKTIEDYVLSAKLEAENMTRDNWIAMQETNAAPNVKLMQYPNPGDFYVDVTVEYASLNKNFVSAMLRFSAFSGGAHGYTVLYPINYDVVNKKVITIKDIMANDPNYLETLSTVSREYLYAKLGEKVSQADFKTVDEYNSYVKDTIYSMVDDSTKPEEANFANFTFTDSEITVYFGQYQVASYADGEQQIIIPRK
jgi:hypothetical protein